MSTPWSPAPPSIVAPCPIARKRSATKASNCGPLIARTISKRLASSWAVGVFGPEKRRTSHTAATTIPSRRRAPSHPLPLPAEDSHPHNTTTITTAAARPPHESLLLDLLVATGGLSQLVPDEERSVMLSIARSTGQG